jgi:hypothetical protein
LNRFDSPLNALIWLDEAVAQAIPDRQKFQKFRKIGVRAKNFIELLCDFIR